jgi:hypothetical protein
MSKIAPLSGKECKSIFDNAYKSLYSTPISRETALKFEIMTHESLWRCDKQFDTTEHRREYWETLTQAATTESEDRQVFWLTPADLMSRRDGIAQQLLVGDMRKKWLDQLAQGCSWKIRLGHSLLKHELMK